MPSLRVHHLVELELNEARIWYAGRSPWAAESFSRSFAITLDRVETRPRSHAPWLSLFRRARLSHFLYQLLFHADSRRTSVLALVYQRSEPERVLHKVADRLTELS